MANTPITAESPVPIPVVVESPVPIPVIVVNAEAPSLPAVVITKGEGATLSPTTTEQEDEVTAGQRRINLIWELTQAFIAVIVVLSNMIAAVYNVFMGRTVDVPMILSSSLFLIIGFYFARTNHQAQGGEGKKPVEPPYTGR